jgi:hypothetical protein
MNRIFALLALILAAALLAPGCSAPPQEEIAAARAEIEKARQAQADVWAPEEFQAAESALNDAMEEIAASDDAWLRSYGKAKELLEHATSEARRSAALAPDNRDRAAADAEAAISAAETELTIAESSLRSTPRVPQLRAERSRHQSDLSALRKALDEAQRAQESQDYKGALEQAITVKEDAASITTRLEELRQARGIRPQK